MPQLLLVLLTFIVALPGVAAAEDPKEAYDQCLAEGRDKKTQAEQKCVPLEGSARAECDKEVASINATTQNYCILKSNIYQARDVNTVQESNQLAEENKARARQAGIEITDDKTPKSTELPKNLINNRWNAIPLPPSRPTLYQSGGGGAKGGASPTAARPNEDPNGGEPSVANAAKRRENSPQAQESNPSPTSSNNPSKNAAADGRKQKSNSEPGGSDSNPSSAKGESNSVYDNVSLAQSEAAMDVQSCQSKQNSASLCCNNPLACASASDRDVMQRLNAGPGDNAGLTQYCSQMQNASKASGDINGRLASTCMNNQYACSNSCASLEQKYRGYMSNCDNCESYSVFMNAASQLANYRSACSQLQAKGDQLTAQSMNSTTSSAYSQYCQQQASMSPQSMSPSQQAASKSANSASGATEPAICAYNPAAAGCSQAAALNAAPEKGQGGFGSGAKAVTKNSFAVQDLADSGFPGMKIDSAVNPAPTVRAVPNGGGGGFGGGMGAGGGATLGGGARPNRAGPSYGGGSSPSTEIEQGFRSGGYTQPAGTVAAYEPSGYDGDRGPRAQKAGALDLKQYLPGGSLAPVRRLAGSNLRSEINAKEEDLFRRISLKIYEKCRLGILWRCD